MVARSGDYFRSLAGDPGLAKQSKKYFMNQFRILKSKMTYRSAAEFLRQVGGQLEALACLTPAQREAFFDVYLSRG